MFRFCEDTNSFEPRLVEDGPEFTRRFWIIVISSEELAGLSEAEGKVEDKIPNLVQLHDLQ